MALIRCRRPNLLRVHIPEPLESWPCFPLPPVPSISSSGDAIAIDDLEKLVVLGHGNGGTVYKVRHKSSSTIYALKVIHGDRAHSAHLEASVLYRAIDCPQVVNFHGYFKMPTTNDMAILMEYMDAGSLATLGTLSEDQLVIVARHLLNGLAYLHAHNIAHLDIKPANILVNTLGEVKIADFGVSKVMSNTLEMCHSSDGTCAYMSPERLNGDLYDGKYNGFAADVWSLGLTLFELYVGHFPLLRKGQRPDWATLMYAICFDQPPSLPETASPHFHNFLQCCLKKESSERWMISQLLTHPFVCKNP